MTQSRLSGKGTGALDENGNVGCIDLGRKARLGDRDRHFLGHDAEHVCGESNVHLEDETG